METPDRNSLNFLGYADEKGEGAGCGYNHNYPLETEDESGVLPAVREQVLERDRWACKAPGCWMRKNLDVHHITFRSQGGGDEPEKLLTLCRVHHDLVHRGICRISGEVGKDLKFERPKLVTEQEDPQEPVAPPAEEAADDDDESWREQDVADIFDGPPAQSYKPPFEHWNDFINHWIAHKQARELEERSRKRRAKHSSGAHVCAESELSETTHVEAQDVFEGSPRG